MKPFNLEEAKAGKPVCTRDGKEIRIICFDCITPDYPIVALTRVNNIELISTYTKDGKWMSSSHEQNSNDLMMADVINEGYINIYKDIIRYTGEVIFETEEIAKKHSNSKHYLDTIKIQWKE